MNTGFQSVFCDVRTVDGLNCIFLQPVEFVSTFGIYRIPQGATTDGFSVPQVFWNIIPPFGKAWKAAALHDAAYRGTLEKPKTIVNGIVTEWQPAGLDQQQSDMLINEAMESLSLNPVERETIYHVLRVCGQKAFAEDRKI